MLHSNRQIFRLCRRHQSLHKHFNHSKAANDDVSKTKQTKSKDFKKLYEEHKGKITFSSYLEHDKLRLGIFQYFMNTLNKAKKHEEEDFERRSLPAMPLALQYLVDKEKLLKDDTETYIPEPEKPFQLPLANKTNIEISKEDEGSQPFVKTAKEKLNTDSETGTTKIDKWMTNYEHFDDTYLENDDEAQLDCSWSRQYGTPDPNAGVSQIPCGGCGALLHCSDPAIPGYLPSEIYKNATNKELKGVECQRCHFLKEYNVALDVSVAPEEYERLLQTIKNVRSLVLLIVDLLDYPCSIWPGIVDIVGPKRPIIVVGNKVDLLPGDSKGYLKRVRESLLNEINKTKLREANIQHVALISAKTGYGVENLITAMFKVWLSKGDVFLVGCTNVGKSSLFNALLQSDYCKVHATDIIKRATVSRWPGTTLNLLKFPINRPSGWKIHERNVRLKSDSQLLKTENFIRKSQIENVQTRELPSLIGHIGRSFSDPRQYDEDQPQMEFLNEKHELFSKSKWLYDTPGIIHPDQTLTYLTTEELLITIPKSLIRGQTYYLREGSTIFIGGLARMDFVECPEACRFTIYCSDALPITVVKTEDADFVYKEFLGTELFGAPMGSEERMSNWPGLSKHSQHLEFEGEGPKVCCGDIVLSSAAWVSVTAKYESVCKVEAWTPLAKGIYKRYPSMLPYAVTLKGKRIPDTPAYQIGKVFVDNEEHIKTNYKIKHKYSKK